MDVDRTGWSGDGELTARLLDALEGIPEVAAVRVEDAPASRAGAGYAFLSNELFVRFSTRTHVAAVTLLRVVPWRRRTTHAAMTLDELAEALRAREDIGPPDYVDEGMLQYLRSERITAPYQSRGVKMVEMVRIYVAPSRQ